MKPFIKLILSKVQSPPNVYLILLKFGACSSKRYY
uniref:Uncharacterized protein n=1 Tax=Lepeophtheirus salmonis TaxID=72036 RepID=A0A0K2TVC8_LEPSM